MGYDALVGELQKLCEMIWEICGVEGRAWQNCKSLRAMIVKMHDCKVGLSKLQKHGKAGY